MEFEMLKTEAKKIVITEEMKNRIAKNCNIRLSQTAAHRTMKNTGNTLHLGKPAVLLSTLFIGLTLSLTTLAATGILQGFFQDIYNFKGAIVSTSYEQASDEIHLEAAVHQDTLTVSAVFVTPEQPPYCEAEKLSIAAYQLVDANGTIIKKNASTESSAIHNGQASFHIPVSDLQSGNYKLIVNTFVTEKKADQPLPINGTWEYTFTK